MSHIMAKNAYKSLEERLNKCIENLKKGIYEQG